MTPNTTPQLASRTKLHLRLVLCTLIVVCLAGVFHLYGRPDFLVLVANQVWTCF